MKQQKGSLRAEGMVSIMIDSPTRALLHKQAAAMSLPLAYYVRKIARMIDDSNGQIPLPTDERLVSPIDEIKAAVEAKNAVVVAEMEALRASYSELELAFCWIVRHLGRKTPISPGARKAIRKIFERSIESNEFAFMEVADAR